MFVNAALGAGYDIRAGVYRSEVFKSSDHLEVVKIDALKGGDVDTLVAGCDAVVSIIGHVADSPAYLQTTAISNVLSAMKRHRVNRLISLTGTGVRQAGDAPSLIDILVNLSIRITDPARMHDGRAQADVIRDSEMDWTIVRVLKLTDGLEQNYSLTDGGPALALVSRHTAAEALLRILHDRSHIRQMPVISRGERVLG